MVMIEDPGAPGYWVSGRGRILGRRGGWLKLGGSPYLEFKPGRGSVRRRVHIAVCEAFHGPRPSSTHVVRHLNGNHLDNRAENLAWGTPLENVLDSIGHGTWKNQNTDKTHCPQRHPLSGPNLLLSRGKRYCRTCNNASTRRWRALKDAE